MPEWQFVAFNPKAAAAILAPIQQAVQAKDANAWQKLYDQLAEFHPPAQTGHSGVLYPRSKPITAWFPKITKDQVPEYDSEQLKLLLMLFLEAIAAYWQCGRMSKPCVWVGIRGELDWKAIWISEAEGEEHRLLVRHIFDVQESMPDPFWFLKTRYLSSSYISPEIVKRLAEAERNTGFLRRLGKGLDGELGMIGYDMARLGLLIELAAMEGLALHYQEHGT